MHTPLLIEERRGTTLGLMRSIVIVLWSALAVGCGHVTKTRPTPEGQVALEGSLGGPMARVSGRVLPLPLTTLGASYGVSDRADVHAHLHGTAAVFGIAGVDVGSTLLLLEALGARPAVALTSRLYGFTDFEAFRPYLEVTGAASYLIRERVAAFVSASGLAQTQAWPVWAVGAGAELRLGRAGLQLEGRWYQPHQPTRFNVVDWQGPGGQGAFGALLGARYRFGEEAAK